MPSARDLMKVGDEVWLVPNRPAAPRAAYSQPMVRIISLKATRATVELPDGTELETDVGNLRRTPPRSKELENIARKIPVFPKDRNKLELPEGWKEEPLW